MLKCGEFSTGWSSPVARLAHNQKVGGSNPSPVTNFGSDKPESACPVKAGCSSRLKCCSVDEPIKARTEVFTSKCRYQQILPRTSLLGVTTINQNAQAGSESRPQFSAHQYAGSDASRTPVNAGECAKP